MHPDGSHQARLANELEVDLYLGVRAHDEDALVISYFATTGFSSPGGARLAELLARSLAPGIGHEAEVLGRRLPVLRETRMTAVDLRIGPIGELIGQAASIAEAAADSVIEWLGDPLGSAEQDPALSSPS